MIEKEWKTIYDIAFRVNVDVALFGIRNYNRNAKQQICRIKLINDVGLKDDSINEILERFEVRDGVAPKDLNSMEI